MLEEVCERERQLIYEMNELKELTVSKIVLVDTKLRERSLCPLSTKNRISCCLCLFLRITYPFPRRCQHTNAI